MLSKNRIQLLQNITLTRRERGKVLSVYQCHNIVVDVGCAWMAQLVAGEVTSKVSQIGFGIGGSKQQSSYADQAPLSTYPTVGARSQTDTNPSVTALERPVAISSTGVPVTPGADVWLKTAAQVTHPATNRTCFTFVVTETELSFGTFTVVPVSEVALFTSDKNPTVRTNQCVAYDTLAAQSKVAGVAFELEWTLIF